MRPIRVYVAAACEDQAYAARVAEYLDESGAETLARWLHADLNVGDQSVAQMKCLEDIDMSDALVLYNPIRRLGKGAGGRHFELGYAFARGKAVAVLGARENVFHYNPDLVHVQLDPVVMDNMVRSVEVESVQQLRRAAFELVTRLTEKVKVAR